jgi:acetyltransferase-like isoleucine patch superfamily enzyme
MTIRAIGGSLLAWSYYYLVGNLPWSGLRHAWLRKHLGGFGTGCDIQMGCRFLNGRRVFLGARNVINFGCMFDGRRYNIRTGSDVSIGPEATILTLSHDPQSPDFEDRGGDVLIGDRVWVAYRAVILPGVTIGEGAVVASGAIVTTDIEPFTIVGGVPARKIGERNRDLRYRLDSKSF